MLGKKDGSMLGIINIDEKGARPDLKQTEKVANITNIKKKRFSDGEIVSGGQMVIYCIR